MVEVKSEDTQVLFSAMLLRHRHKSFSHPDPLLHSGQCMLLGLIVKLKTPLKMSLDFSSSPRASLDLTHVLCMSVEMSKELACLAVLSRLSCDPST